MIAEEKKVTYTRTNKNFFISSSKWLVLKTKHRLGGDCLIKQEMKGERENGSVNENLDDDKSHSFITVERLHVIF